jgi:hypothetical protein
LESKDGNLSRAKSIEGKKLLLLVFILNRKNFCRVVWVMWAGMFTGPGRKDGRTVMNLSEALPTSVADQNWKGLEQSP